MRNKCNRHKTNMEPTLCTIDRSPALQIRTVLLSIQALLSAPEPDDPLDPKIAEHFKKDPEGAAATAAEYTKKYASDE